MACFRFILGFRRTLLALLKKVACNRELASAPKKEGYYHALSVLWR